ncbi:MAG: hypothetical protein EZS28_028137 [Streblomastix strix]|uniref:Uncharacterized protein n=1 Tax=Streblomastix strix TaxID=222440 RepID=A0A5J4V156_9EUKA|nr:MAG: hypothetical protein EZS28_028137 [Streblomastix strix]
MDSQPNMQIELSLPHKNGYNRWETSEAFAEGLQMGIMRYMLYLRDPLRQNSHIWGIREKVRLNEWN